MLSRNGCSGSRAERAAPSALPDHADLVLAWVRGKRMNVAGDDETDAFVEPSGAGVLAGDPQSYTTGTGLPRPVHRGADEFGGDLGATMRRGDPHADELQVRAEVVFLAADQTDGFVALEGEEYRSDVSFRGLGDPLDPLVPGPIGLHLVRRPERRRRIAQRAEPNFAVGVHVVRSDAPDHATIIERPSTPAPNLMPMRLAADPDALEFAGTVRELLARSADSTALRQAWDSDDGRIPGLWQSLAEIGALGLAVPESYGGSGLDLTAVVPMLIEAGRACLPGPFGDTVAGAVILAATAGDVADEWLPRVVDGSAVLGLGTGGVVPSAGWADLFLIATDGVCAVPRSDCTIEPAESADRGIHPGYVSWPPEAAQPLSVDVEYAVDVAAITAAAQLVGLAAAMLDMAVAYAKTREQFGRPIGEFQAVKHQLADVYVANAFAGPVVARAAWSVARGLPSRSRDASHAKLAAAAAATRSARTALQVHAGIGYTYEHDLHMWLKRTWSLTSLWGDDAFHRSRARRAVLRDATPPPRVP